MPASPLDLSPVSKREERAFLDCKVARGRPRHILIKIRQSTFQKSKKNLRPLSDQKAENQIAATKF